MFLISNEIYKISLPCHASLSAIFLWKTTCNKNAIKLWLQHLSRALSAEVCSLRECSSGLAGGPWPRGSQSPCGVRAEPWGEPLRASEDAEWQWQLHYVLDFVSHTSCVKCEQAPFTQPEKVISCYGSSVCSKRRLRGSLCVCAHTHIHTQIGALC